MYKLALRICILLFANVLLPAQTFTLDQLFVRPYVWGTRPEQLKWSRRNHTLVFLWNAAGRRFLDLYAYHADEQQLVRLTDLESQPADEWTLTADERDSRRRQFPMPDPGISTAFDVAQDGSEVAFAYRGELYCGRTTKGSAPLRLTRTRVAESAPAFSPDAKRLAYLSNGELYVEELARGVVTQLTQTSNMVREFEWSPDGKQIAYLVSGLSRTLLLPNYSGKFVTATPVPRSVAKDDPPEVSLFVVPGAGGKAVRLNDCSFGAKILLTQPLKWSPDSKRVLWVAVDRSMKKLQIVVSDASTAAGRAIFELQDDRWAYYSAALWSPDGRQVLFSSDRDGHVHLYRTDAAAPQVIQVTRGNWDTYAGRFSSDPDWVGDFIYFGSTEVATSERHYYRVHPDGSGKEQLSRGAGMHLGQVSPDGQLIAYLNGRLSTPADVYVGDRQVTHSPLESFSKIQWPDIRFVQFPSRQDRKMVAAKMFLPHDYAPGDRSTHPGPAVIYIHGGGYSSSVYKEWGAYLPTVHAFNEYLADHGYVVLDIDYRGSAGYGRDWRTGIYLDMGGPDLEDVLGGVDYLRSLGNIDMARLGIWGISYGGFMTNTAMFKAPDVFRAGVAWSAVNDWENYLAWWTRQRLTRPAEHPEAYQSSSPIHFSQNLKGHLLMLHGMSDDNVLFQDFVQLTEKLLHEGKSVDTFFYPEENHLYYRDESVRDSFRRTAEWFDRYLGAAR